MLESLTTPKKALIAVGVAAIALGFAYHVAAHPMDFRVYHYGARGVFNGTRPVYGQNSGLGWPMHYRYPPLFLLLFAPFAALPLGFGAAVWLLLKFAVLACFLRVVIAPLKGAISNSGRRLFLIPILFIAPYIVEELRYGNAQFFVFALTAAALWLARRRPALAAVSLALAISIKVWPLFFVPYLVMRRDWKVAAYSLCFVLALALLPSLYFGLPENLDLLRQWFGQESHIQLSENEIWFPNQSLRGVLMRYLTVIDYSQVPDSNYAQINIATIDPASARLLWMIIAGAIYGMFLFGSARRRNSDGWLDHGLGFCLLALLQPFTQKYALAVLLWPAIVSTGLMRCRPLRFLMYAAAAVAIIQPLVPGASAQRLLQVLGLDFVATVLVTIVLAMACTKLLDDSCSVYKIETHIAEASSISPI